MYCTVLDWQVIDIRTVFYSHLSAITTYNINMLQRTSQRGGHRATDNWATCYFMSEESTTPVFNPLPSAVLLRTLASLHRRFLIYLDTWQDSFDEWSAVAKASTNTWQHNILSLKRDSNPWSQRPSDQGLRLRPPGHWDRLFNKLIYKNK
jgi:hypothetical protein